VACTNVRSWRIPEVQPALLDSRLRFQIGLWSNVQYFAYEFTPNWKTWNGYAAELSRSDDLVVDGLNQAQVIVSPALCIDPR
jgi:hypothetical protein